MNSAEIIRAIEALPDEERRKVEHYFRKHGESVAPLRAMDSVSAAAIADRVFDEHRELFQRLAD